MPLPFIPLVVAGVVAASTAIAGKKGYDSGDAAHPMYPIGSNGASQAILDADGLGQVIAEQQDAETTLKAYEALRREATANIV